MKNRNGFALLIVLVLMGVGTALMFNAMNAAAFDDDMARSGTARRRALVVAETELWSTFENQRVITLRSAPSGTVSSTSRTFDDMTVITTVDKVDTSNVWIVARATLRRPGIVARHRIGLSVTIPHDTAELLLRPLPERAWAELF